MDLLTFLIIGFSTWRLSSLLVAEEGPFHLFTKIRIYSGMRYWRKIKTMSSENGTPIVQTQVLTLKETLQEIDNLNKFSMLPSNEIAKALSCIYCTSMWVGIVNAILFYNLKGHALELFITFNIALAFSGFALFIHKR